MKVNKEYFNKKFDKRLISQLCHWLSPGIGIKRWLLVTLIGVTMIGIGLAIWVLDVYRNSPETWWLPFLSAASLRYLVRPLRVLVFGCIGLGLIFIGIWGINHSLMRPYIKTGIHIVDTLANHRRRERGPKIVTVGGGHGMATILRGLKKYTHRITAIVSVADDGGSSGKIRRELGLLPPGDIRNCLAALSNDEALLSQLFQYRFSGNKDGLEGHSFGNLFISALAEITGSFESAVVESGKVLGVNGQVVPSTLHEVQLQADILLPNLISEVRVSGESKIPGYTGQVRRVWLEPNSPPGFPQAINALLGADLIVIGPGSLYTSILPNLLVPDLADAIRASRGLKLYVCNVATQIGETEHFSCADHILALEDHIGCGIFNILVANNHYDEMLPGNIEWVKVDDGLSEKYLIYQSDLVDHQYPWRHDSEKVAKLFIDLLLEKTGPLVE